MKAFKTKIKSEISTKQGRGVGKELNGMLVIFHYKIYELLENLGQSIGQLLITQNT